MPSRFTIKAVVDKSTKHFNSTEKMNVDTLSYMRDIKSATNEVLESNKNGCWALIGYVYQNDSKSSKLSLLPINVIKQGDVWIDLLMALEDDLILYALAKMEDLTTNGIYKTFFIHWIGEKVGENVKTEYAPHFHEIRNIMPQFDCLISSMDAQDIQKKVHQHLSQTQEVNLSLTHRKKSRSNSLPKQNAPPAPSHEPKERVSKQISTAVSCLSPLYEDHEPIGLGKIRYTSLTKYKVSVIGDAGVGKTSIYCCFKGGGTALDPPHSIQPSTKIDQFQRNVEIGECELTLDIWDTAGQERYKSFASCWLRNAYAVLLVYDITDESSFLSLTDWLALGKQYAKQEAVFLLVGNKADLETRRVISQESANKFANKHGLIFTECSGLTGYNISHLFDLVARRILIAYPDRSRHLEPIETLSILDESNVIQLSTENTPLHTPSNHSKKKCCIK